MRNFGSNISRSEKELTGTYSDLLKLQRLLCCTWCASQIQINTGEDVEKDIEFPA